MPRSRGSKRRRIGTIARWTLTMCLAALLLVTAVSGWYQAAIVVHHSQANAWTATVGIDRGIVRLGVYPGQYYGRVLAANPPGPVQREQYLIDADVHFIRITDGPPPPPGQRSQFSAFWDEYAPSFRLIPVFNAVSGPLVGGGLYTVAAWIPIALLTVICFRMWQVHRRRLRKLMAGHCECGYTLAGLTTGECPECGRAISAVPSAADA